MTDAMAWQGQVGQTWATEWERTDRSLAPVQDALLERLGNRPPPSRILDIGCGAGSTTIAAAARFPDADCLGIDLSPALVDAARSRSAGTNCRFQIADASRWADPAFSPDALFSRHGVMFFDDPVAAFANLRASAVPEATLTFSCFRQPSDNVWATSIMALLPAQPVTDPHAPGPFAFVDRDRVADILTRAGWLNPRAEPFDWDYVAGSGDAAVTDALDFFGQIGPAARAAKSLEGAARAEFRTRLEGLLHERLVSHRVVFKAAAWIWTAHR